MDEKSRAIIDSFPESRRSRSQLAPYRDLILELHRRGCPFREIARILSENFGLAVAATTISRFAARPEQKRQRDRKINPPNPPEKKQLPSVNSKQAPAISADEIRRRIAALKQRRPEPEPAEPRFKYDATQPLHLNPE